MKSETIKNNYNDGETLITGIAIFRALLADPRDYKWAYRDTDGRSKAPRIIQQLKMTFEEEFDALFEVKRPARQLIKRDGELLDCARSLDSWIKGNGVTVQKDRKLNEEIETFKHMTLTVKTF